jgi:hypothetical protein
MTEQSTIHPLLQSFLFALYVYLTALFATPFVFPLEAMLLNRHNAVAYSNGEFVDLTLGFFLESLYMGIPCLLLFWFGAHQINRLNLSIVKKKFALMAAMAVAIFINFLGIFAIAYPYISLPYLFVFSICILIYSLPTPSISNTLPQPADHAEPNR